VTARQSFARRAQRDRAGEHRLVRGAFGKANADWFGSPYVNHGAYAEAQANDASMTPPKSDANG